MTERTWQEGQEQGLHDVGVGDTVASGEVGDDQVGASGESLSSTAQTDGAMGTDQVRSGDIEANAEAGAHLLHGEAHWPNANAQRGAADVGVSGSLSLGIGRSRSLDASISPDEVIRGLEDVGEALADSPNSARTWR